MRYWYLMYRYSGEWTCLNDLCQGVLKSFKRLEKWDVVEVVHAARTIFLEQHRSRAWNLHVPCLRCGL